MSAGFLDYIFAAEFEEQQTPTLAITYPLSIPCTESAILGEMIPDPNDYQFFILRRPPPTQDIRTKTEIIPPERTQLRSLVCKSAQSDQQWIMIGKETDRKNFYSLKVGTHKINLMNDKIQISFFEPIASKPSKKPKESKKGKDTQFVETITINYECRCKHIQDLVVSIEDDKKVKFSFLFSTYVELLAFERYISSWTKYAKYQKKLKDKTIQTKSDKVEDLNTLIPGPPLYCISAISSKKDTSTFSKKTFYRSLAFASSSPLIESLSTFLNATLAHHFNGINPQFIQQLYDSINQAFDQEDQSQQQQIQRKDSNDGLHKKKYSQMKPIQEQEKEKKEKEKKKKDEEEKKEKDKKEKKKNVDEDDDDDEEEEVKKQEQIQSPFTFPVLSLTDKLCLKAIPALYLSSQISLQQLKQANQANIQKFGDTSRSFPVQIKVHLSASLPNISSTNNPALNTPLLSQIVSTHTVMIPIHFLSSEFYRSSLLTLCNDIGEQIMDIFHSVFIGQKVLVYGNFETVSTSTVIASVLAIAQMFAYLPYCNTNNNNDVNNSKQAKKNSDDLITEYVQLHTSHNSILLLPRVFPLVSSTNNHFLLVDGYIAGTTNQELAENEQLWDLLLDIELKKIKKSNYQEQRLQQQLQQQQQQQQISLTRRKSRSTPYVFPSSITSPKIQTSPSLQKQEDDYSQYPVPGITPPPLDKSSIEKQKQKDKQKQKEKEQEKERQQQQKLKQEEEDKKLKLQDQQKVKLLDYSQSELLQTSSSKALPQLSLNQSLTKTSPETNLPSSRLGSLRNTDRNDNTLRRQRTRSLHLGGYQQILQQVQAIEDEQQNSERKSRSKSPNATLKRNMANPFLQAKAKHKFTYQFQNKSQTQFALINTPRSPITTPTKRAFSPSSVVTVDSHSRSSSLNSNLSIQSFSSFTSQQSLFSNLSYYSSSLPKCQQIDRQFIKPILRDIKRNLISEEQVRVQIQSYFRQLASLAVFIHKWPQQKIIIEKLMIDKKQKEKEKEREREKEKEREKQLDRSAKKKQGRDKDIEKLLKEKQLQRYIEREKEKLIEKEKEKEKLKERQKLKSQLKRKKPRDDHRYYKLDLLEYNQQRFDRFNQTVTGIRFAQICNEQENDWKAKRLKEKNNVNEKEQQEKENKDVSVKDKEQINEEKSNYNLDNYNVEILVETFKSNSPSLNPKDILSILTSLDEYASNDCRIEEIISLFPYTLGGLYPLAMYELHSNKQIEEVTRKLLMKFSANKYGSKLIEQLGSFLIEI
ncbi:MAG: hypothetical protein EZS28_019753 [Streblomastix strix]|uniref:UDENN domain-containing protein n=1 Tax=Streblomastix strix TaxID=222440 RepID=A0A5J4VQU1_9EUKA|nr:MAG: hypothetical protein EZS28_019753 [Streblomastix strix]